MSLFIKNCEIIADIVPFKTGEKFEFKPGINLLVGDQGCGKSTMINMLMHNFVKEIDVKGLTRGLNHVVDDKVVNKFKGKRTIKGEFADFSKSETQGGYHTVYFDTERQNPRILGFNNGSRGEIALLREFLNFGAEFMSDATYEEMQKIAPMYAQHMKSFANDTAVGQSVIKSHGQVILPMLKQIQEAKDAVIFLDEPETSLSIKSQHTLINTFYQCLSQNCQLIIATHSQIFISEVSEVLSLEHRKWMSSSEFLATQTI